MLIKELLRGLSRSYEQFTLEENTIKKTALTEMVGADKGKLVPTDIGMIVNDFLVENFKDILDLILRLKLNKILMILQMVLRIGLK